MTEPDARAPLAPWRDALRDRELPRTAKLVGFVLSTYMTADGRTGHDADHPSPSIVTLARGAGLNPNGWKDSPAVKAAIASLEAAGLLDVERRRGWQGWRYTALIPRAPEGFQSLTPTTFNPSRRRRSIPHAHEGESVESVERGARARTRTGARAREWLDQVGRHYVHDERAFREEAVRALGVTVAGADRLRRELLAAGQPSTAAGCERSDPLRQESAA